MIISQSIIIDKTFVIIMHFLVVNSLFVSDVLLPERNTLLMTKRVLARGYSLTLDIKPIGLETGYTSILHATTGGDCCGYGQRTPGIWFHSNTNQLFICSPVNGNGNLCYTSTRLSTTRFNRLIVRQIKRGSKKQYHYEIWINGKRKVDVVNTRTSVFKNVKYFVGDSRYPAAKAELKNIKVVNY